MNTFLTIIGIHAALVGFALLFAGFMSLATPSSAEIEATRKQFGDERRKNSWRYLIFCIGQAATYRSRGIAMVIAHWPERPKSRKLVYWSAACLAVAAAIGFHLGVFNS